MFVVMDIHLIADFTWSHNLKETSWNSVTFSFEGGKVVMHA